jgi:hypothetical protein
LCLLGVFAPAPISSRSEMPKRNTAAALALPVGCRGMVRARLLT